MTKSNEEAIRALTEHSLRRNKDHYPPGALDEEHCFFNGQMGDCGLECKAYILGNCPSPEEIEEALSDEN